MEHTFFVVLSTGLSTICAIFCGVMWAKSPRRLSRKLVAELSDQYQRMVTLEERVTTLNANHALLLAREKAANRKRREQGDDEPEEVNESAVLRQLPGETGAEWKARMRKLSAQGKIRLSHV